MDGSCLFRTGESFPEKLDGRLAAFKKERACLATSAFRFVDEFPTVSRLPRTASSTSADLGASAFYSHRHFRQA
jgi:hypothetical protein